MNKLYLENYNLQLTLLSGQTFSWNYKDNEFIGITNEKVMKIIPKNNFILWQTYPENDDFSFLEKYLGLNKDYEKILSIINIDEHINSAITKYRNLRILNQDFEQTLFSFILASNKNIKAIRKNISLFREKLGEEIEVDGEKVHLFPKVESFYNAPIEFFKETGIGYRAPYIKDAAKKLYENPKYKEISTLDKNEAKEMLLEIHGVGNKIADCVLTFSLGYENITPIDVWSFKVAKDLYKKRNLKYENVSRWFSSYFNGHAAMAGQFLFEYIRNYKPENYY